MHSKKRQLQFDTKAGALHIKNGGRVVGANRNNGFKSQWVENISIQGSQRMYLGDEPLGLPKRIIIKPALPGLPSVVRLRVFCIETGRNPNASYMNRYYPHATDRAMKAYKLNLTDNT